MVAGIFLVAGERGPQDAAQEGYGEHRYYDERRRDVHGNPSILTLARLVDFPFGEEKGMKGRLGVGVGRSLSYVIDNKGVGRLFCDVKGRLWRTLATI